MRSKFGFAIASLYFLFICGLLVQPNLPFALSIFNVSKPHYWSWIFRGAPQSILPPRRFDDPGSGRTTAIVIYLIGALINAAIIYGICSLIATLISKIRDRRSD
ncbi:MAG: hypothetical protein IPK01_02550 [Acidobacteria bacterium]|nr:hypothetical protein [Acidobacteriota bacterium]